MSRLRRSTASDHCSNELDDDQSSESDDGQIGERGERKWAE